MNNDVEAVVAVLREETSVAAASRRLGVAKSTLHDFLAREGIDAKTLIVRPEPNVPVTKTSVEGLIRERGFDPAEVEIRNIRLNQWGSCSECGHGQQTQDRIDLRPMVDWIRPVRPEGWKPPRSAKSRRTTKGLTFVVSDHHCPDVDASLHACTVKAMEELKPSQIVVAGDLLDYAGVSRHKKSGREPSLNETLQSAYDVLRAYRAAVPGARIVFLDGNHEARLFSALESKGLVGVATLERPGGEQVLTTKHLLRLDELEVEQVFPPDGATYEHAEYRITPDLAVRHGWIASQGSGSSALKTLDRLRRNVIVGHTHRASKVYHSHWVDGERRTLVAAETGCMANVSEHGMGYAVAPDWQQSFLVVQHDTDGFVLEHAEYANGVLRWRDRSWK